MHTLKTLTLTVRETIVTSRALITLPSSDTISAGTLTAVRITKPTPRGMNQKGYTHMLWKIIKKTAIKVIVFCSHTKTNILTFIL